MQISSKVALAISLVVALVGGLGGAAALVAQHEERVEDFEAANVEAMQLFALAVAPAVAEARHERVQAILDNVHNFPDRFPDVLELRVLDERGAVVASLDPTEYNERRGDAVCEEASSDLGRTMLVRRAVRLAQPLGCIVAEFSKQRLEDSLDEAKWKAAAILLGTMIFAGFALHLLHRRLVSNRLGRLAAAAGEIGAGNLGATAKVDGKDEIADLGESFNSMARAIRHYTEDLEQIIAERTEELESANHRLEQLATTDQLTGVHNRRYFDDAARRSLEVARRNERPLSLVLLDIDEFKTVNDTWGHPVGDAVLQAVAAVLVANARKADLVARIGGEEFAISMPEVGIGLAAAAAERMRLALEREVRPRVPQLGERAITASFGVASFETAGDRLEDLMSTADEAMYASKEAGRNRVTVSNRFVGEGDSIEPPPVEAASEGGEEAV